MIARKPHSKLEGGSRDHLYVWMDGPGLEELGWRDQVKPLADFECEHGSLAGDLSVGCECWTGREQVTA